jgi:hypothetical protein
LVGCGTLPLPPNFRRPDQFLAYPGGMETNAFCMSGLLRGGIVTKR